MNFRKFVAVFDQKHSLLKLLYSPPIDSIHNNLLRMWRCTYELFHSHPWRECHWQKYNNWSTISKRYILSKITFVVEKWCALYTVVGTIWKFSFTLWWSMCFELSVYSVEMTSIMTSIILWLKFFKRAFVSCTSGMRQKKVISLFCEY